MRQTSTAEDLRMREYVTPSEAVLVWGHSPDFWRGLFDTRQIKGYTFGNRGDRHLNVASIRKFLDDLSGIEPETVPDFNFDGRDIVRAWREDRKRRKSVG